MSPLICALSLLNNVLRRGSRVWINSRYTLRFSLISLMILAGSGVRFFGIVVGLNTVSRAVCIVFVNVFICSSISSGVFAGVVRVSVLVISRRYLSQSAFLYLKIWMNFGEGGGGERWEEFRDKGFVVGCDYERF
jgi:hypothetical protein